MTIVRAAVAGVEWAVRRGERWAVVGPNGVGKSTLFAKLLGRKPAPPLTVEWPNLGPGEVPSDVARLLDFREQSRVFGYAGGYYQQRYDFADSEAALSLGDFLTRSARTTPALASEAAHRFGLGGHLDTAFVKLSNGQTRRARLAALHLAGKALNLLDDPFLGLDAAGREVVAELLGESLAASGRAAVVALPRGPLPTWTTHVLRLNADAPAEILPAASFIPEPLAVLPPVPPPPVGPEIVALEAATVRYPGRVVLDGVNWTVCEGERWAVVGPNGSGKSTLTALLLGDHPQAYANRVRLFGRPRGGGESIWDVKRRIGYVSPEFHLFFPGGLSVRDVVATGFADHVTPPVLDASQAAAVAGVLADFGLTVLAGRRFSTLSTGEQRLALVARAVVKRPPLLVLDEPFQGLDGATTDRVRRWLDAELPADSALIFITHDAAERPGCVTHTLRLSAGRVYLPG